MSREKMFPVNKDALENATKAANVSQKEIAEKLNRTYKSVNASINGRGFCWAEILVMAQILNCDPRYLVEETNRIFENGLYYVGEVPPYSLYATDDIDDNRLVTDFMYKVCGRSWEDYGMKTVVLIYENFKRVVDVLCDPDKYADLPEDDPRLKIARTLYALQPI